MFGAALLYFIRVHTHFGGYIQTAGQPVLNTQNTSNNSSHFTHPAGIDNSLDGGIFSIFIVTAFKFLGFPGLPYPNTNLARAKGKEMAVLGGKNLIKQIL